MTSPFRQSALDRLSSPEQLDQLLEVTRPSSWIALAGAWLLVAIALGWSIVGRLPVTIAGSGLLLSADGVREVEALGAGVVQTLGVRTGDLVEPGKEIARISQPRLEQEVAQARDRLRALEAERADRARFLGRNDALETRRFDATARDAERRLVAARGRVTFLEDRVRAEREARALGLVTETSVQQRLAELDGARGEVAALELEEKNDSLRRLLLANNSAQTLAALDERIDDAARALQAKALELTQASRVVSPYRGYVREIRANVGQLTAPGQALLSIEIAGAPVEAVVFVSNDGKRIEKGMDVRISPVTVQREEHGYMLGTVRSVSEQPVTIAGMTRVLGNDILVQRLAARGAAFLVEVELQRDSATASGFRWSSRRGPPVRVGTGTSIDVSVVVARRRPIELLLPFLRSAFGLAA